MRRPVVLHVRCPHCAYLAAGFVQMCVRGWFVESVPPPRALHISGILRALSDAFHAGDTFSISWSKEALCHVGPGVCVPPGFSLGLYPCVSSASWPLTLLQPWLVLCMASEVDHSTIRGQVVRSELHHCIMRRNVVIDADRQVASGQHTGQLQAISKPINEQLLQRMEWDTFLSGGLAVA